ncbi:hypothetical protein VR7878_01908 [Vibrio ruber DSM 16370]|uniref:Uncharacterized protein n=1 Tax=Vibrio ruber (strain DSM 16370 / JCM 11486 / BCRC 17186 / CECT 7878 / LMG 23124 / VR1) TaxID=1123498 RepID=A0A1R4LJC2_VIBR1|nr:hypothetical protein [Vibrio ruber]SJN56691.1 hypothetical protein VR7878_01908 [Vibrio ruber DSM 16370]
MIQPSRVRGVFDYTAFLDAACHKQWTLFEVFFHIEHIVHDETPQMAGQRLAPDERLWKKALQNLSLGRSDQENLMILSKLAKAEGINTLQVMMPYALDTQQLHEIERLGCHATQMTEADELLIEW